jgi:Chaperone of endosialidase
MADLKVDSVLGSTPQQIKSDSTASKFQLSERNLYLKANGGPPHGDTSEAGRLVLGHWDHGSGEWIQNSATGYDNNTYGIAFYAANAERARVTTKGLRLLAVNPGNGTEVVIDKDGYLRASNSSARFKEDVRPLADDFHKVLALEPVAFTYKETGEAAVGYIAEDLHEKGLQNLVAYDAEGRPVSIHYKLLPVYLLEIVKAQQSALAALLEQVKRLQADRVPAVTA